MKKRLKIIMSNISAYINNHIFQSNILDALMTGCSKIFLFLAWVIYIYTWTVISILVLISNAGKTCNKPLYTWLIAFTIIVSVSTLLETYIKCRGFVEIANNCRKYIRVGIFVLYLFSIFYLLNLGTCRSKMPQVYIFIFYFLFFYSIAILLVIVSLCLFCCFTDTIMAYIPSGNPASQEELDRLCMYTYNSSERIFETTTCCICLENYVDGENLRILPCDEKHNFHQTCVDSWLKKNKTCPLCRKDISSTDV